MKLDVKVNVSQSFQIISTLLWTHYRILLSTLKIHSFTCAFWRSIIFIIEFYDDIKYLITETLYLYG